MAGPFFPINGFPYTAAATTLEHIKVFRSTVPNRVVALFRPSLSVEATFLLERKEDSYDIISQYTITPNSDNVRLADHVKAKMPNGYQCIAGAYSASTGIDIRIRNLETGALDADIKIASGLSVSSSTHRLSRISYCHINDVFAVSYMQYSSGNNYTYGHCIMFRYDPAAKTITILRGPGMAPLCSWTNGAPHLIFNGLIADGEGGWVYTAHSLPSGTPNLTSIRRTGMGRAFSYSEANGVGTLSISGRDIKAVAYPYSGEPYTYGLSTIASATADTRYYVNGNELQSIQLVHNKALLNTNAIMQQSDRVIRLGGKDYLATLGAKNVDGEMKFFFRGYRIDTGNTQQASVDIDRVYISFPGAGTGTTFPAFQESVIRFSEMLEDDGIYAGTRYTNDGQIGLFRLFGKAEMAGPRLRMSGWINGG